jgi:hypothetical protein
MSANQYNIRLPRETAKQIQELIESTEMTQTQLMIVAIDRMFHKEREFFMKRTTTPQEAALAIQDDKIVKMSLAGRNWRVSGLSEGKHGWVAAISHPDYPSSRAEIIENSQEFVIYSQAEYRRIVDELRASTVE